MPPTSLRRIIPELITNLAFTVSGRLPSSVTSTRGLRILTYHGVVNKHPFLLNHRFISTSRFESHLRLFTRCFNLISLEDLIQGHLSPKHLNVLLTFDDGYRNNYDIALPLLRRYKVPALFFVNKPPTHPWLFNDILDVFSHLGPAQVSLCGTAFTKTLRGRHWRYVDAQGKLLSHRLHPLGVEQRDQIIDGIFTMLPPKNFEPFSQYLQLMSVDEMRALNAIQGYDLASHTNAHPDLTTLSPVALSNELQASREWLRELGGSSSSLAFPYGAWNEMVVTEARRAGFDKLFGTELRQSPGQKVIPRLTINPFVSAVNEIRYIARDSHE